MSKIQTELVAYGVKIAKAGLVAGAGGNISAREGGLIWMKPSGFAMDDIAPGDLCGMDLKTGRQVRGRNRPTSEVNMHLAIYRERPEVVAVFHTHSPWVSGVISARVRSRPTFAECARDLGRVGYVPYVTPTTERLANAVGRMSREHDTLFMVNHGVLAVGITMQQAYRRCVVAEHAGKSMVVAAAVVKKPRFLTEKQIRDLVALVEPKRRRKTTAR